LPAAVGCQAVLGRNRYSSKDRRIKAQSRWFDAQRPDLDALWPRGSLISRAIEIKYRCGSSAKDTDAAMNEKLIAKVLH
jgi:hypothetical protein